MGRARLLYIRKEVKHSSWTPVSVHTTLGGGVDGFRT
jgi:hypothetical protein